MTTLAEFATGRGRKVYESAPRRWFRERPAVLAEVEANLERVPSRVIHAWLVQEHEFPFSFGVIVYMREQAALRGSVAQEAGG